MKETKLANRYAKALFELALEMKLTDPIRKDAELLLDVCAQNQDFVLMLKSPVIKEKKKIAIIKEIFENKFQDLFLKFMVIITNNRREDIFADISEQYIEIYKKYHNILSVSIETAYQVDNDTRDKIISLLERQANAKIELTESVKKELIGGFVLSTEDKQYDASVLRKIKNLRKEFDVNLYIKGF
jgi:F-type H+-transporting ATPase subunit delta